MFEDVLSSNSFWRYSAEALTDENRWCRWARVCFFSKTQRSQRDNGGCCSLLCDCPALTPPCLQLCPSQKYNGQQSIPACTLRFLSPPGSHDSFSFYIDEASPVGPEQPETVQNFVSVFGTVAKKLMRKWLATQTMNFTSQLEAGIRFFDLRISTKPRDPENELFFAHGLFSATVSKVFFLPAVISISIPKRRALRTQGCAWGQSLCKAILCEGSFWGRWGGTDDDCDMPLGVTVEHLQLRPPAYLRLYYQTRLHLKVKLSKHFYKF